MCTTCGCSDSMRPTMTNIATGQTIPLAAQETPEHSHAHPHDHEHRSHSQADHEDHHHEKKTVLLEQAILSKNDRLAERNRGWLAERHILALNLVSSPGSGKTTLLEKTIADLQKEFPVSVIEGDQATLHDAERLRRTGCAVVQINTGAGCHLEADMVARGLESLQPSTQSVVMIENVGNLVCPALFDLGEQARVVILSVTEGEDKPLKYPHMFQSAHLVLINKIDLLPYLSFDIDQCLRYVNMVNTSAQVLQISAQTGEGLSAWYRWIQQHRSIGPDGKGL
ncbi:MAG: hydrogenase nickel incorporation protein HypB [Nitrospirota bacterium]|nr:hydrogenase nickel incorporation protein HypB [Nitrospirota bacterium]MDH5699620.1 hydrogenase nickel incorporation protein HypB [Nitrospirota bacterium]